MNRSFKAMAFVMAVALVGCETDVDLGARPQFWNGSNNLTLLVFDGQTGAGVVDATVTLQVGPTVLTATRTDNVYVLPQIPQGTFPVFIQSPGYLPFVATQYFSGGSMLTSSTPSLSYQTFTAVLFPVRSVDHDITVRAYEGVDGDPVAAGQVVAQIDVNQAINAIVRPGTSPLPGALGFLPRTIVATIANGLAVLPKDQLVFGAVYDISVIAARNAAGEYLEPATIQDVRAGDDFPTAVIFMGPPAETPAALRASNEDGGTQQKLIVTFPYPVEVCSEPEGHAWRNVTPPPVDTDNDGTSAAPHPQTPVTVALSESDTVLTVGYEIDPAAPSADDPGDNLSVQFAGIEIRVVGASTCTGLGAIRIRGAATVDTTIVARKVN
ncbi:MAG: hypothetical protein IPL40_13090 [Proteobacteria bacterium]|nr:hypothetical protein [Pseudomonadota bacterium]